MEIAIMQRTAKRESRTRRLMPCLGVFAALASSSGQALNGCTDGQFIDYRGLASLRIANDDPTNPFRYRPRCAIVSEGTRIEFAAVPNFGMHPLYGGVVDAGQATIDPDSPIGSITQGTEAERLMSASGEWPFFCDIHFNQGMSGSIQVVPELFADGFEDQ